MNSGWLRQAVIILVLAALPALGEAIYFRDKISWKSPVRQSEMVSVDQAREWGNATIWVDARPQAEFEQDHIPDAILLNEDNWNGLLPQLLSVWSPDKKVVVYCDSGRGCNASREVAKKLRDTVQLKDSQGNNCVFVLEGGWESWQKARQ